MNTKKIMTAVAGIIGGVIGIVIIADVIGEEMEGEDGAFVEEWDAENEEVVSYTLAGTVVNYIVPLLAIGLLATGVGWFRFR